MRRLSTSLVILSLALSLTGCVDGTGAPDQENPVTGSAQALTSLAPLLTGARFLGASLGQDGLIYAVGGTDKVLPSTEAYNTSKNVWAAKAPMITPRDYLAVTTGANGRIYAVGGYNGNTGLGMRTFEALN